MRFLDGKNLPVDALAFGTAHGMLLSLQDSWATVHLLTTESDGKLDSRVLRVLPSESSSSQTTILATMGALSTSVDHDASSSNIEGIVYDET